MLNRHRLDMIIVNLNVTEALKAIRINNADERVIGLGFRIPTAVGHVKLLRLGVIDHRIGINKKLDRILYGISVCVQNLDLSNSSINHENLVRFGKEQDAVWSVKSGDALKMFTGTEIEDFNTFVFLTGKK